MGITALCLLALKQAETPNDHPSVRKAVRYVVNNTDSKVYSEGLAAVALEQVDPERYKTRIKRAYSFLAISQNKNGAWSYGNTPRNGDNSNTQFAVLGLAAAERCGIKLAPQLKKRARDHWLKTQSGNGSWGYSVGSQTPYMSMSCAGLASLYLLGEKFERKRKACGTYEYHKPMMKGLKWVASRLKGDPAQALGSYQRLYALYALERVAIFWGVKEIGGVDWYRWGAAWLVGQNSNKWRVADKAFVLLFLAKGSAPIAIAKWHWEGDWNNQHQDVHNWCEYSGRELGVKVDWLPAKLDRLNSPAAKASMIFVNGRNRFVATKEEIEFLRSFLDEGGTVVAEITCNSSVFTRNFQRVLRKELYPDLKPKFVPVTRHHPVTYIKHKLKAKDLSALEYRAGCKRLNVLVLMKNISCALNGDSDVQADLPRARKVATNILAWALQNRMTGAKLDTISLKEPPKHIPLTADQVKRVKAQKSKQFRQAFGRLKHSGNWYAAPRFFATVNKILGMHEHFPRFDGEVYVGARSNDLFHSAVLFITGYGNPALTDASVINLRTYLQNGGFIFAVNACTSREFNSGFRKLVKKMLPHDKLEKIPLEDPIYKQPFNLNKRRAAGTKAYVKIYQKKWAPLYGVRRGGRWVLVYSNIDLCSDISDGLHEAVAGYKRKSGALLTVNILYAALLP